MVIQEEIRSKTHPEENGTKILLEEAISKTDYFSRIERTTDGGIRFTAENYGEFDNYFKLTIILDRQDINEIMDMHKMGMI